MLRDDSSEPPSFSLVVVGKGRLGRALQSALARTGRPPVHLSGRETLLAPESALEALRRSGAGALLLLAVKDDAVAPLAESLASASREAPPGAVALHLAGALEVGVLGRLGSAGFALGSCHPLQTFTGSESDADRFAGCAFAVAGDPVGREAAQRLVDALGGFSVRIPSDRRSLYHVAASLGANGLTGLVGAARDALVAAGLAPSESLSALGPLLRTALDEALRLGPEASLTGPAARDDVATLERHRLALLAWDASRTALLEALLSEQRRLARRGSPGPGC